MKKASFVMPVRNGEKFIEKTLNSLVEQTYKNIEIIIANDHSEDKTENIVKKFIKKDKRIKYINLDDTTGEAAGRNAGTDIASGDIIFPADVDDPSMKNRVEITIKELEKNKADVFYGNLNRFYLKTGIYEPRHFQPFDATMLKYINFIPHGAAAYKKIVYDTIKPYDVNLKIGTDYDFWLKAQEANFNFCSKNIPLALYTMHPGQVTNFTNQEKIAERQKWNKIIRKKHNIYKIDEEYVKKHAESSVADFYLKQNHEIWFGKKSIPNK